MLICQWHGMFKINLIKNEFRPKGNDDMMHCVKCNKSSLLTPRLKTLNKQRDDKYLCGARMFFECCWSEKH
jgi:hypothetical protein